MALTSEKLAQDGAVFTGSQESVEVVEELERRRQLVAEGRSALLTERDSWESLRAAGCHV